MRLRTFIFLFSFCFGSLCLHAQAPSEKDKKAEPDSISYREKYGLRVGADLSMPIRTLLDDHYTGFEILGDYRFNKNIYFAAEIGNENYDFTEPYLAVETKGSYFKVGANYNSYENWLGMQNELYVGVRAGFATFSQHLEKYAIYNGEGYFDPDIRTANETFKGLTASWIEMQLGIKTQVLNNLYLSVHADIKRSISQKEPDNFANLYIPGFHRTYGKSSFGVGWGYSISYMIPIFRKTRVQKVGG